MKKLIILTLLIISTLFAWAEDEKIDLTFKDANNGGKRLPSIEVSATISETTIVVTTDLTTSGVSVTIEDAEGFTVYSATSPNASTTHTFYHYGLETGESYSITIDISGTEFCGEINY